MRTVSETRHIGWQDDAAWQQAAEALAQRFITNFEKYTDNDAGKALVQAGPQL